MSTDKQQILVELINFSEFEKPLDSNHFREKFNGLSKRELTLFITDLIDNQDEYMICSKEDGYYIARTIEEANRGIAFIGCREIKLRLRRLRLEELKIKLFGEQEPNLFEGAVLNSG